MVVKLSPKEMEILQLKQQGLKNKQIAEARHVSEADISQTLSRITEKINSIQDVFGLLQNMGMFENNKEIELTESGRALLNQVKELRYKQWGLMERNIPLLNSCQYLRKGTASNWRTKVKRINLRFKGMPFDSTSKPVSSTAYNRFIKEEPKNQPKHIQYSLH